jgi:hypothetical protein
MKVRKHIYVFHLFLFSICVPVLANEGDFSVSVSEGDSVVEEPSTGEFVRRQAQNPSAQEEKAQLEASQGGLDDDEYEEEPSPSEFVKLKKQGQDSKKESEVLQGLRMDLDQDGRMDSVRILRVPGNGKYNRLEVKLAKGHKSVVFQHLIEKTWQEKFDAGEAGEDDGSACIMANVQKLQKGVGNSFRIKRVTGDYDGCHNESGDTLTVRYLKGELRLERFEDYTKHFSMGDPSEWTDHSVDFRKRKILSHWEERHTGDHSGRVASLPAKCEAPTLQEYEKSGLPDCAH